MEAEISLAAIEALIFAAEEPISAAQLRRAVSLTPTQLAAAVEQINADLEKSGRPYEIVETAGGYRFRTRPQFGELIAAAQPERRVRLSRPALDCLAVIAYRQPISRPEIEELRSVDCGAVLRSLLERGLIRIVGRRDAPGRPALYATSPAFLETFGLLSLRDLPDLRELLAPPASEGSSVAEALAASDAEQGAGEDAAQESDAAQPEPERDVEEILSDLAAAAAEVQDDDTLASESAEPSAQAALEATAHEGTPGEEESRNVAADGDDRATPESVG
jgi:segregation and condensation protein B